MSHDELSDLLQSLPRASASDGFTSRTLARVGERRHVASHLRAAFAILLSAIMLLTGAIGVRRHEQQIRVQQLRAEQQQIRKELEELKTLSNEREPRVFVGSSGSYDIVVGLKQRSRPAEAPRPVSLQIPADGIY
jgi:hypothetical protein